MPGPADPPHARTAVVVLSTPTTRSGTSWDEDALALTHVVVGGRRRPPTGLARRVRRTLGLVVRTARLSLTHRCAPSLTWRYLRAGGPRRAADVVISTDPRLDATAALAARVTGAATVVHHDEAAAASAHLDHFRALLQQATDHVLGSAERTPPDADAVRALRRGAAELLGACPPALVPVDLVAAHARSWVGPLPHQPAAQLVEDLFGGLPWPGPGAGASGLGARLQWARLSTDPEPDGDLDPVRRAAALALDGARVALEAGAPALARSRWCDAWELLYHRELHTDVASSPLVEDPEGWIGELVRSPVMDALVQRRGERDRQPGPRTTRDRPSVVVATGLSGDFHGPVADALATVADVETLDVVRELPRLRRRGRPSLEAVHELAAIRGLEEDPRQAARTQRLRRAVDGRDVVFSDWADASTVWLSAVCPPRVRLVVRVHSVDALDAWFPLVDWVAVDEVVVSPALRSLVVDLLAVRGITSLPVTVLPPLVAVRELAPDKEVGARSTLGMIGWGRRVKDVAWALDLLELDPRWRLVLVGSPLAAGRGTARARTYQAEVADRLRRPDLAARVEVLGWCDDVAEPLRRVGVILSTSRRESLHYGLVEGAASGAVPVVRDWPVFARRGGARAIYPAEWVVQDVQGAAARIREATRDEDTWERTRAADRERALALFDPEDSAEQYRSTVLGTRG